MSPQAKWEYLEAIRGRYLRSGRRDKGLILDEFYRVLGRRCLSWRPGREHFLYWTLGRGEDGQPGCLYRIVRCS